MSFSFVPRGHVTARLRRWAAVFALGLLAVGSGAAHAFTIIVTENDVPLVPNSVLQLAGRLGYFDKFGVHVKFLHAKGTPLAVAALVSHEGDMANVSLDALLALVRQGQPGFRAISAPAKPIPYVMIARNAITSLNDLTGKTFGVGQAGTLDATLSEHLLAAHGMGSSVNMVGIGPPIARVKALAAGRIDATAVSIGTWSTDPYKEGFHVLADRGEFDRIAPRVAKVNVVSLDTLQKSRGELVKVTAALMALSRDFSRHPETWSDAMAAAKSRASRGQLQQLADVYRKDWCIDDCLDPDSLRSSIRMLQAVPPSSGTIADFSIVAEAKRLLARASHWPSNGSAIAKSP